MGVPITHDYMTVILEERITPWLDSATRYKVKPTSAYHILNMVTGKMLFDNDGYAYKVSVEKGYSVWMILNVFKTNGMAANLDVGQEVTIMWPRSEKGGEND